MKIPEKPATPGPALTLLSVVIPARNEAEALPSTVEHLRLELRLNHIPHEIVVVDDGSTDRTWPVLQEIQKRIPEVRPVQDPGQNGFGRATAFCLRSTRGDCVVIMMADESDDVRAVVRYWRLLNEGWDCV